MQRLRVSSERRGPQSQAPRKFVSAASPARTSWKAAADRTPAPAALGWGCAAGRFPRSSCSVRLTSPPSFGGLLTKWAKDAGEVNRTEQELRGNLPAAHPQPSAAK